MVSIILSILKFVGTVITGILGIVGITTETHQDREIPAKVPGGKSMTKRVITPQGKKILRWTIAAFIVAVVAQIAEETKSYLEGEKEEVRANTMLTNATLSLASATQSLAYVTRMVSRFQTFSLDAEYDLPLPSKALTRIETLYKASTNLSPATRAEGILWVTNQGVRELRLSDHEITNVLATSRDALCTVTQLINAEFAVDVFADTNATNSLFSTFGCEHHQPVEISWVPGDTNLTVRWKVFFPNALWYQTRYLITDADFAGKVLQVAIAERQNSDFAALRPASLRILLDGQETELGDFTPVDKWVTEQRLLRVRELVNKPAKKGAKPGKTATVKSYLVSTNVLGLRDPARGRLVAIYQTKIDTDSTSP